MTEENFEIARANAQLFEIAPKLFNLLQSIINEANVNVIPNCRFANNSEYPNCIEIDDFAKLIGEAEELICNSRK